MNETARAMNDTAHAALPAARRVQDGAAHARDDAQRAGDVVAEWSAVTRRYGGVTAVQGVSLDLRAGEATALVGHNGAGKTTLIKLLLGLIRPTQGSVRVLGVDPAGARSAQARRTLGFLPESVAFHGAMTGAELMGFYARLKGHAAAPNRALLAQVGLAQAADRRVSTYSKGMRQRLGIAQALIGQPRLLLFDEPTSGLDPASRAEVFGLIDTLRGSGATVLVSTHALAEMGSRVDRVAVMHRGRLLAAGTLAQLRAGVEAPVRIGLRVRPCGTGQVLARLGVGVSGGADASGGIGASGGADPPGQGVRCVERGEASLVLAVPPARKMDVLRMVAQMGELVEDVGIDAPGLEQLYGQLVAAAGEAP